MSAPDAVLQLVQRFTDQIASYHSAHYNETETRRELIDPLFRALGWDVDNSQHYAEAYKDVIHEDAIKIGGVTKAPDYAFRIGGTRKFFVEAKKPAVNVHDEITPAFQLRRYAWTARLPLSILTDFEEFAVYDCRQKPDKNDKPATGRILYLNYKEYVHRWDEIAGIFSRDAILKGSFDRYAEETRGKHGTMDVDDAFLAEIEHWRDLLAHNIALRNPHLGQRELNYAVQMTVDRIIFLRICEDRGIEPYGRLQALINGGEVYSRLVGLFRYADQRYNSGLFHFNPDKNQQDSPDELTPSLVIDDRALKEILGNLYYPESPYEFSVLPASILGQVYEQFLGKVIRKTSDTRAVVEDKPEVKKAGGVYYTPAYIVDYIVKHTVGALLDGKKPGDMGVGRGEPLRVLDPACGSGSFLLGAYQFLLDWYRDGYTADGVEKWSKGKTPTLYQARGGEWKLTTAERKRILLDHIYGVDIDSQAVEVTKLSLLLKVLEGENEQTLQSMLDFYKERVLPNLGRNIKCGNSLIGPDYYTQGTQLALFDKEEQYRVNAFDWQREFGQVFLHSGGFDAVIGNPPYVRQENLGRDKEYYQKRYRVYHGMADLYAYFIEKGVSLTRPGGLFSYIVANKWMRANYGQPLRVWLKTHHIEEIIDFGDLPVFQQATTYPCILRIRGGAQADELLKVTRIRSLDFKSLDEVVERSSQQIQRHSLQDAGWSLSGDAVSGLMEKLKQNGIPLGQYVNGKIFRGILTGLNEAFVIDSTTRDRLIAEDARSAELIKPFLAGRDIKRYITPENHRYLIIIPKGWTRAASRNARDAWGWFKNNYPAVAAHLIPYEEACKKRQDKGEYWWELRACDYYDEFEKPKIIYPNICKSPEFTFDPDHFYANQKCFIITGTDKYLLGLLNSRLSFFLFQMIFPKLRGDFFEPSYVFFKNFPIRRINASNPIEIEYYNRMVTLVEHMLALHKQLHTAALPQEKALLQRQIDAADREIDNLVYELYGLTADEIKIVEGESSNPV
ncbi:MAG: N-6 DNA methylase [Leptolinea sp.]|jgi:predicted type IV restriction endonuclease|nr:N-6 DNA methylase [Leptolinea sp.]